MTDTPTLGLHTWAPEDPVDVAEVNENFEAIDRNGADMAQSIAALAAAIGTGSHTCRIAFGTYTGNGSAGETNPNTLRFDFVPVALLVMYSYNSGSQIHTAMNFFVRSCPYESIVGWVNPSANHVSWNGNSISWYNTESNDSMQSNINGREYQYVAIGYSE